MDIQDVYECHCCDGYAKYHCEEIDLCSPAACKNGGICVDINQGHDGSSYQCLCPYGKVEKKLKRKTFSSFFYSYYYGFSKKRERNLAESRKVDREES